MDDPNITMEEYIRLEEEKAQKHGKVFNWETAKYGKIWYNEDIYDLISLESEFPAIAFNDELSSKTLSREPTVSSLNNEIDFRISFDNSDDEDYTVIFEKNSFSFKKNSTNDLKTDSKNDNEKVMPSLPSPKPTVSYLDDLDFFKEFENEFPAIVYNDAQTSKSDLLTEPILSPQHIDEFDLNDETSLSEYDEEEQNILYFNDLFPFNIIHPDDLKSENDNDDNDIDIIQSSEEQYGGLEYTDADIEDFETRLTRIYRREVHRVQVFNFGGLPDLMAEGLSGRMLMEHRDAQGADSARKIPDKGGLRDYWIGISSAEDFLGTAPSYTAIRDLILRLYHRLITCSIAERSQAPKKDTHVIDEGGQVDPAPVQAPPPLPPPAAAGTIPQRMAKLKEDVHDIRGALTEQREVIDVMARDFSRFCTWTTTSLARMMDRAGVTYTSYSQRPIDYTRHVRRRTDGASTSIAQQNPQQPDS
ncbi:hypothetical protein Tco_0154992 [Tanacetum coccineum]